MVRPKTPGRARVGLPPDARECSSQVGLARGVYNARSASTEARTQILAGTLRPRRYAPGAIALDRRSAGVLVFASRGCSRWGDPCGSQLELPTPHLPLVGVDEFSHRRESAPDKDSGRGVVLGQGVRADDLHVRCVRLVK